MAEILTQTDIDALLAGDGSAAGKAQEVVPWNFALAPRVPRDRRAVLQTVFARYAQQLEIFLSASLRTTVGVSIANVEQVAAREFLPSLAAPCAAVVFDIAGPTGARGILDFGTDLAFYLLDRLFGGTGEGTMPRRSLTAVEQSVLWPLAERVLLLLGEAWQGKLPLSAGARTFESDPGMIRIPGREDGVVVATLGFRAGDFAGGLVLGLPSAALEPSLQDPLRAGDEAGPGRAPAAEGALMQSALRHVHLALAARLPVVRLSVREIACLAVGQVIHTDLSVRTTVDLHVNGSPKFQGALGQVQRHVGLRIAQRVASPAAGRPARPRKGRVL